MDINRLPLVDKALSNTEVYTNLQGLQSINMEENRDEALKKVAQQFESMFVNMMTKSMRQANAVFEKDSLFNSNETNFYRDMLDQQRSLTLSHGRGLGIADAMYRQMSRNYGGSESPSGALAPKERNALAIEKTPLSKSGAVSPSNNLTPDQRAASSVSAPQEDGAVSPGNRLPFATSPEEFVDKVLPYAKKAAAVLGVDHLLLVAQSALETGWGKHILSDEKGESSFNFFNIKKGAQWENDTVKYSTLEYKDGQFSKESADFRAYQDITESFNDYLDFVTSNTRYAKAVELADDPAQYIQELHSAGYATDPHYSDKVLSVYQQINQFVERLPTLMKSEESSPL